MTSRAPVFADNIAPNAQGLVVVGGAASLQDTQQMLAA